MENPMRRRNLLQFACAIMPMAAFVQPARAATPDAAKVVYHLADLDKVGFVLGNIRNHFDGMGGPEHVTIALVVHGPALKAFHLDGVAPATAHDVEDLRKAGLGLSACIHTMEGQHVTLKDLLPGFAVAEKGGVVKLAELQAQGYAYLRP
jgi:intracellular sulfur oxidation DsrE/DsrF family protein